MITKRKEVCQQTAEIAILIFQQFHFLLLKNHGITYLCCVEEHEVYQFVSCTTTTTKYIPLPNMGQICLVQQRSIKSVYNFENKKGEGREKKHSTPQKKIRKNIIYIYNIAVVR